MTRILFTLAAFLAAAVAGHLLMIRAIPSIVMGKAIDALIELDAPMHAFALSPKMTPQTQTVVRPSPDLAYSICIFDLAKGDVMVEAAPWRDYASLSVFDASTNNVFVTSLEQDVEAPRGVMITKAGRDADAPAGLPLLSLDANRGVILIRRLAPTQALFDEAAALTAQDKCALRERPA